jgi:hypothetical protein
VVRMVIEAPLRALHSPGLAPGSIRLDSGAEAH